MHRRSFLAFIALLPAARPLAALATGAAPDRFTFRSIDGGPLDLRTFRGGPVLVVNTASRCGFTPQFEGLQALWEQYSARGLTVVGVPSSSFRQELSSAAEVKDFCEVNFSVDFPMTDLVAVTGPEAHPFYVWAAAQGVAPAWNFHKILLDSQGLIAADFPAPVTPEDPQLRAAIEATLLGT
ncbi:MAG: glutathione peroxidase [Rhodobacteraceae bacterium]|nr:glutathione peroxidase [Paracoccaceae bacterium]